MITTVVELHDRLYRSVAPVRRAAMRAAPESAALRTQLSKGRHWSRAEIERVFADELAGVADDGVTLAAVELALSFEAWDQCATAQELAGPARREVISRVLRVAARLR